MLRLFVCVFSLVLVLGAARAAEVKVVPKDEQVKVAQQVRDIFEAKCLDCHGPELPRPKGKFGYVLDLKRIAENSDYVAKGDPDKSDIYTLVRDDEMPGEDANVPPLTKEEKEIVKRWVEIGAPGELPEGAERAATPVSTAESNAPTMPFWKRLFRWMGHFHPASTHFPVGLLTAAVLAEALAWWTRRESWLQTVRFLVILGAAGAVGTAGLGWINAWFSSYVGSLAPILKWHRWLGTVTAVWAVGCAVLCVLSECKEGTPDRQRFRGALLLGAVMVAVSGFLGGALIYGGLDHYAW